MKGGWTKIASINFGLIPLIPLSWGKTRCLCSDQLEESVNEDKLPYHEDRKYSVKSVQRISSMVPTNMLSQRDECFLYHKIWLVLSRGLVCIIIIVFSGGSKISWGQAIKEGRLIIRPNFPENCMKMENCAERGRASKMCLCRSATGIGLTKRINTMVS